LHSLKGLFFKRLINNFLVVKNDF